MARCDRARKPGLAPAYQGMARCDRARKPGLANGGPEAVNLDIGTAQAADVAMEDAGRRCHEWAWRADG